MALHTAKTRHVLTDAQWSKLEPLFPHPKPSPKGGRPWASDRKAFEGILWILWTGAPWSALPKEYPSPSTCWRRLRDWEEQGVWESTWQAFLAELDENALLDWQENFIDGSFASANKGGSLLDVPERGWGRSGWWWWTVKACLWQPIWTRPPRGRQNLFSKRLRESTLKENGLLLPR